MKQPFLRAVPLLNKIEQAGFEAYFVGGSVRDFLLGREISDVDIATSATPLEIKGIFSRTIDVGIEHGTVIVLFEGDSYEITTFRSESEYVNYRRPKDVEFISSLKGDLERRDFTMNAIAMDKSGNIIDPFNGKQAIQEKVIKTVGVPEERFNEDALRMMRAVRFVSQLSFEIEHSTFTSLVKYGYLLEKISIERITVEFEKLLSGNDRNEGLRQLTESGLYQFLPGFRTHKDQLERLSSLNISYLQVEEIWIALLHLFNRREKEADSFLREWKLPIKRIHLIQKGLAFLEKRLVQDWTVEMLYEAGLEITLMVEKIYHIFTRNSGKERLAKLENSYLALPIKNRNDLVVSGSDLMNWYHREGGPWVKEKLSLIESAVLNKLVKNEKETIREWLLRCNQN